MPDERTQQCSACSEPVDHGESWPGADRAWWRMLGASLCRCCRKCGASVPCAESTESDGSVCAGVCFCGVPDAE